MRTAARSDPARPALDAAPSWTGALALLLTAAFYALAVWPLAETAFGEIFAARGRVPYAIAFFAWWAAVILAAKALRLRRERAALALDLLPERLGREITPESSGNFLTHLAELPEPLRGGAVADRLRRALVHFASRRDPHEVAQQLGARAQADADAVESSYTLVRVFIWAVPILGFIGTVIGIGAAVGGFSASVDAAADVTLMKQAIGGVTAGLAVAFDTTLLALVVSIVIMLPASALQKAEEDFLAALEDYTDAHLVPRLAGEPAPRSEAERIQDAIARAMAAHHAELRSWQARLEQIGELLTGQVLAGWEKIDERLRVRQAEQLEELGAWASARQREASDELSETQRQLLRDFHSHLEGMAAEAQRLQQSGAHRLDEQLAGVERLHRRLQDEGRSAGESQRAQAQQLAAAADDLARTLGRIRAEAGEVRDAGDRALDDFAGQLRAAARDAQAFQRELMAAQEAQGRGVEAAGGRLAATLARLEAQLASLDALREQQRAALDAAAALDATTRRLAQALEDGERRASPSGGAFARLFRRS